MTFSVPEMIAAIVHSAIYRENYSGKFGTASRIKGESLRINVNGGPSAIVKPQKWGWSVTIDGFEGIDTNLEEAVRNALDGSI